MIAPGHLDRRLVLEAPVEAADGAGGLTRTYQTVTTLWASMTPFSAREQAIADRLGAAVSHRIVIRAGREVTTRHRFRDGARLYDIAAFRESADRRFTEIDAQERKD